MDTWVETSVIKGSLVKPGWRVRRRDTTSVDGLGSIGDAGVSQGEEVEVPVQMRYGGTVPNLVARVVEDKDMQGGADVLFGTRFQRIARMKYDCDNLRVELLTLGLVIDLEAVGVLMARMEFEPLRVLEPSAWMSGSYCILIVLGCSIEVRDAVEMDSEVAAVATKTYPLLRHAGERVDLFQVDGKYHLALAGSPCQPWSHAAGKYAKGFRDERAKALRAVCDFVRECMGRHPGTAFMVETVVVNKRVQSDAPKQSDMMGAQFQRVSPVENGWPQSRERRIATNVVGYLRQLEQKVPFGPNVLHVLRPLGMYTTDEVVPCVMASVETHAQLQLYNVKTQSQRRLQLDAEVVSAAEVLQGHHVGVTSAWGTNSAPPDVRRGNAFDASFVQSILRNWMLEHPSQQTRRIMAMTRQDVEDEAQGDMQTPLEKKLKSVTDEQLGDWMEEKLVGCAPPELNLEIKPGNEAAAQFPPRVRYQTAQKLHAPIMAALRKKRGLGSLRLVRYTTSQWISPMFVKPKGRQDPIIGLELLRFLTDFRAVNQELCWKTHWVDWMPTLEDMRVSISRWARWVWAGGYKGFIQARGGGREGQGEADSCTADKDRYEELYERRAEIMGIHRGGDRGAAGCRWVIAAVAACTTGSGAYCLVLECVHGAWAEHAVW